MRILSIYLSFWLVLMAFAIGNGVLREATYGQYLSELPAHQLSTLIGALVFGIAVWLLKRRWAPESTRQAVVIGISWLVLTLCFEFTFGHYIAGHSWSDLFRDYDVSAGRVWPLLLVWVTFLPYLAYRSS